MSPDMIPMLVDSEDATITEYAKRAPWEDDLADLEAAVANGDGWPDVAVFPNGLENFRTIYNPGWAADAPKETRRTMRVIPRHWQEDPLAWSCTGGCDWMFWQKCPKSKVPELLAVEYITLTAHQGIQPVSAFCAMLHFKAFRDLFKRTKSPVGGRVRFLIT